MKRPNQLSVVKLHAFSEPPASAGNPAGVAILPRELNSMHDDEAWMFSIAKPITAFLRKRSNPNEFDLRWWSPDTGEAKICGHATLASAATLFSGHVPADATVKFHNAKAGVLSAKRTKDGRLWLNFPADLLDALGVAREEIVYVGDNGLDWLVELKDERRVAELVPDLQALDRLCTQHTVRGCQVTARCNSGVCRGKPADFVCRCIFPSGEDAVTGSAHCFLTPYWIAKLSPNEPTKTLRSFQVSERGGCLYVRLIERGTRVEIGGHAVTVGSVAVPVLRSAL